MIPMFSTRSASRAMLGPWVRSDRAAVSLNQRVSSWALAPETASLLQPFPEEESCPRRWALSTLEAFDFRRRPSRWGAAGEQVELLFGRPTRSPAGMELEKPQNRCEETASDRRERAGQRVANPLKNPLQARTPPPESSQGEPKGVTPLELGPKWAYLHSRRSPDSTHRRSLHR